MAKRLFMAKKNTTHIFSFHEDLLLALSEDPKNEAIVQWKLELYDPTEFLS